MPTILNAGAPLETTTSTVGRRSVLLHDASRDRWLGVDCWYPARPSGKEASVYELLPGVGFTASAVQDAPPADGEYPLVVWSHGRTGTRFAYAMLCEGLAARGYVVVASDHPGDTLADWVLGAAADDATNEAQRQDDVRFVLDATLHDAVLPDGLQLAVERIALAGHSYGAHTVYSLCGAETPDPRIKTVVGMQALTRNIRRSTIRRITIPMLMIVGNQDRTTPSELDADRAFSAAGPSARRVDIAAAGHQGCSDVGLYLELAPHVEDLPDLVRQFIHSMADNVTGTAGDPWRPTVGLHLALCAAWLDDVFGTVPDERFAAVARGPGVTLRQPE